ncbi:hypothetical protein [Armatimonas sp.]|uniref:hypothetical protein n=1 Tax=Armatimonas sp. TaxID=1872638 RepID=UPI003753BB6D
MTQHKIRSVCLLLSPQELGLLRAILSENAHDLSAQQLLVRVDAAETAQLLPLLSRALSHVGLTPLAT